MCGINKVIHICPSTALKRIDKANEFVKIARLLALLIHGSAYHIVRALSKSFETTTPRGVNDWEQLEAGYRLEYCIFGDWYEYEYWKAPSSIIDASKWVNTPFLFTDSEKSIIKVCSRAIQNPKQSGIDADYTSSYYE